MDWRKYNKTESIFEETFSRNHSALKRYLKYIRRSNIWRRQVRFYNLQPTFLQWRRWKEIKKIICVLDLGLRRLHSWWRNCLSLENGTGKFTVLETNILVYFINWEKDHFQFHDNLSERDARYWWPRYNNSDSWNPRRDDKTVGNCMEIH